MWIFFCTTEYNNSTFKKIYLIFWGENSFKSLDSILWFSFFMLATLIAIFLFQIITLHVVIWKLYYYWYLINCCVCSLDAISNPSKYVTSTHPPMQMRSCRATGCAEPAFLKKVWSPTLEDSKIIRSENIVAVFILVVQFRGTWGYWGHELNHLSTYKLTKSNI